MANLSRIAAVVLVPWSFAACRSEPPPPPIQGSAALIAMSSCEETFDFIREVTLERMNQKIDAQLEAFAKGQGCYRNLGVFDSTAAASAPPAPSPGATTETSSSGARAGTSSGTNNQVAGVDEADFVKNDGKYIYLAQNGVLRIIDGYPAASARELSATQLDGKPRKLFVEGDRALVYVSVPDPRRPSQSGFPDYYYGGRECTYGYGCSFTGDGTSTKLEIFDVSDRAAPKKVRELSVSGSLIAARRIGSTTHTVVSDDVQMFPELVYSPDENLCQSGTQMPSVEDILHAHQVWARVRQRNREIIQNKDLTRVLPQLGDSAGGAAALASAALACNTFYRARLVDGANFTSIISVDMSNDNPVVSASIVSSPGAVYASDAALYIAVPSQRQYAGGWYGGYDGVDEVSSIHKFRISTDVGQTAYVGSGVVAGRVLNQFAMDEKDAHLRVATTTGYLPSPNVESQLTVLADRENQLVTVGKIEHIAPSEDIRSVRFDGGRAFVVTFKKTDPLFTFDLSNPTAPKILGELKIPGFSTYMHMLDENHLLTIGYDADDHGSFAYFSSVLVQIFDVTDPTRPALAARHAIGTRGSSSEALTNHLAFNYFPFAKTLALPMTICEGGGDGRYGDTLTFSGLMLFHIDPAGTIAETGRVSHPLPPSMGPYGATTCGNWWTNASSEVKRSIFMDRFIYSISSKELKVQSLDALGTDLQNIPL